MVLSGQSDVCQVMIEPPKWWSEEAPERIGDMIDLIKGELNDYAYMPIIEPPKKDLVYDLNQLSWVHKYRILTNPSLYNNFSNFLKRNPVAGSTRGYGAATLFLKRETSNRVYVYPFTKRDGILHLYRS